MKSTDTVIRVTSYIINHKNFPTIPHLDCSLPINLNYCLLLRIHNPKLLLEHMHTLSTCLVNGCIYNLVGQ